MSKSFFQSMSDDELWRMFNDIAETLTERMATEKQELTSRLMELDSLTARKKTDETTNRPPYRH
jgi:hypothetical protein